MWKVARFHTLVCTHTDQLTCTYEDAAAICPRGRGKQNPQIFILTITCQKNPLTVCLYVFVQFSFVFFLILKNRPSLGSQILLWHFHPRLELGERTCLCSLPQMLAWAEPCDHQPRRLHCNPLGTSYRTTQKLQLVLSTVAACLHENVSWRKWTVPAFCCQPRTRFRGKIWCVN